MLTVALDADVLPGATVLLPPGVVSAHVRQPAADVCTALHVIQPGHAGTRGRWFYVAKLEAQLLTRHLFLLERKMESEVEIEIDR